MSTRLTQLNLVCITAAKLISRFKKYKRRPYEGAFFYPIDGGERARSAF
jgi:hypothetical protein